MNSAASRSIEEKEIPYLRKLTIPGRHGRIVFFPNDNKIYIITHHYRTRIEEHDLISGRSLRIKELDVRYFAAGLLVNTFKNKIALSFYEQNITLIVNKDTLLVEQELNFFIELIEELDDRRVCLIAGPQSSKAYIADAERLDTVIVNLSPPATVAGSICVLSGNELAILTKPSSRLSGEVNRGELAIWKESKSGDWSIRGSAAIDFPISTTLKKLNETQIIQMSNFPEEYVDGSRRKYSRFSLIDTRSLTCRQLGGYEGYAYYALFTGLRPIFNVLNSNTLLMQHQNGYFFVQITSRGLIGKKLSLQLERDTPHFSGLTIENGKMLLFRSMLDAADPFVGPPELDFRLFDLLPLPPSLSKDSIGIKGLLCSLLPSLPADLSKIIADYYAGDFPVLIEGSDSLIPIAASSAAPARVPEDKDASAAIASPRADTTDTLIRSSEGGIALAELQNEMREMIERLTREIARLRLSKWCCSLFINYEIRTKSEKKAALSGLMKASSFEQLQEQAEILLRDRSARIHRAGTNTITAVKGKSRTTELLQRIVAAQSVNYRSLWPSLR